MTELIMLVAIVVLTLLCVLFAIQASKYDVIAATVRTQVRRRDDHIELLKRQLSDVEKENKKLYEMLETAGKEQGV